jgi:hypothetical protein
MIAAVRMLMRCVRATEMPARVLAKTAKTLGKMADGGCQTLCVVRRKCSDARAALTFVLICFVSIVAIRARSAHRASRRIEFADSCA